MRAAAANLFRGEATERQLVIDCFNVLLEELAVATPSARQRLGNPESQGLQLPAIYALAAQDKAGYALPVALIVFGLVFVLLVAIPALAGMVVQKMEILTCR
jgi:phycobilisome core-membrane linker protein